MAPSSSSSRGLLSFSTGPPFLPSASLGSGEYLCGPRRNPSLPGRPVSFSAFSRGEWRPRTVRFSAGCSFFGAKTAWKAEQNRIHYRACSPVNVYRVPPPRRGLTSRVSRGARSELHSDEWGKGALKGYMEVSHGSGNISRGERVMLASGNRVTWQFFPLFCFFFLFEK